MARVAAADGITDIFLTSHLNFQYRYNPGLAASLRLEMASYPEMPNLHSGCEVHLTCANIDLVLETPDAYTLGGGRRVLVELPEMFHWTWVRAALERLVDAGLQVIIAHPERNPQVCAELKNVEEMVEDGYLMQLTGRSLTGGFGPEAARAARCLLKKKLVHFVASDGHSVTHRKPLLSPAYAHLRANYGAAAADVLTRANGSALLAEAPIERMPVAGGLLAWPGWKTMFGFPQVRANGPLVIGPEARARVSCSPQ